MRKLVEWAISITGLFGWLLTKANWVANHLGFLSLPTYAEEALITMSQIPTLISISFLIIGCAGIIFLFHDYGLIRKIPLYRHRNLPSYIPHVRANAYFDQLEDGRLFRLSLAFLNMGADEISLESVNGNLSFDGIPGINSAELHSVAWTDAPGMRRAKLFGDLDINIQQSLSAETVILLLEKIREGNSFSIKFHLHIKAKPSVGGAVLLRTWDGVSCQTTQFPIVMGRALSCQATG